MLPSLFGGDGADAAGAGGGDGGGGGGRQRGRRGPRPLVQDWPCRERPSRGFMMPAAIPMGGCMRPSS